MADSDGGGASSGGDVAALAKDDFRTRSERAIQRAGLTGDPYGELHQNQVELHEEQKEMLAELRSNRAAPVDLRLFRKIANQAMSSEERRRWMIGCAIALAVSVILGATAGWSFRDSMLLRRCLAMYQSDVCLAITK